MKIYLAGSYERHSELREYMRQLEPMHEVTSTWLRAPAVTGPVSDDTMAQCAMIDLWDVKRAHAVIVFSDPREMRRPGGGRHTELGLALAWGKRVYVVGPREQVFHYLPEVIWYREWEELRQVLCGGDERAATR